MGLWRDALIYERRTAGFASRDGLFRSLYCVDMDIFPHEVIMKIIDNRFGADTVVSPWFERYQNGQLALELVEADTGEDWCMASVALPAGLPDDLIAIKNWSENEGMSGILERAGLIEGQPVQNVRSGFVQVPVYRLTAVGLELARTQLGSNNGN
jgi:hypothetical protein